MSDSLILVVNPGSASRKYALFADGLKKANVHFEFVDGSVVGTVEADGKKQSVKYYDQTLENACSYVLPLLHQYRVIEPSEKLQAIGVRVVAPSDNFAKDMILDDSVIEELKSLQQKAPIHITTVLAEIQKLKESFAGIPLIAISDSAFHSTKPVWASHYGISTELAEKFGIKRYGYHGISVGSVVRRLAESNNLKPKTIVCHIGSGSSITALLDGHSIETTMGYSPLEGLMMSTRSGSIDVAAALAIMRELKLSDIELEQYLNKKSGLLGVSGGSDDIRQLLVAEEQGDKNSKLALQIFVYKIQQAIGQMAASLGGVDCLVFTATISERSFVIRDRILKNLGYLGFEIDKNINEKTFEPKEVANIASQNSKPVLVAATDESAEIARRTEENINR
jgi:acetate kinase